MIRAGIDAERQSDWAAGLRLVGMPHRQARLYLALSRGPQTARRAAEIARLHRATAYRLLVRLFGRGLIVGDAWSPQRFQAVPPEVLLSRLEGFLRDEADLCATLTQAYAKGVGGDHQGSDPEDETSPVVVHQRGGGANPVLTYLESARQTLDLVVRPVDCSIPFRPALIRTLGNLGRRGVRIRLLTDALPPDQRFVTALGKDGNESRRLLSRRILAPVGAHYYICDGRVAVRIPSLGPNSHLSGLALIERHPDRVRQQSRRFEELWAQSSEPLGPARSTRAYAWNQAARIFDREKDAGAVGWAPFATIKSTPPQPTPGFVASANPSTGNRV